MSIWDPTYRYIPNMKRTFVGNKTADHSDVGGTAPVGAAPTTSSFSTKRHSEPVNKAFFYMCVTWQHVLPWSRDTVK